LLGSSILARLPLAMFSIALLVHARQLTGSFAVAGLVSGAYAICGAVAAPLLGRLVDRYGQTAVLIGGAAVTAVVLVVTGSLPADTAPPVLVALAGATGLATPPLAACVRTLLPAIVAEPGRLPALFAFESTVLELTFVFGPPLALWLGVLWSTGAALILSGLVMLVSTLAFAAQPASRRWRPTPHQQRPRGGSLHSPAMRTLILILFGTGAVFGATDIAVTAAARTLGATAAAGPLLGLWGVGSLLGGIAATRLGGAAQHGKTLTLLLAALTLGHAALAVTTASIPALAGVILLAGATIAPTVASIYAMVDRAAPAGTQTEAFSWLLTASSTGAAAGAALGGTLAQTAGAPAAFAIAGLAGALATLTAALKTPTLDNTTTNRSTPRWPPRSSPHAMQRIVWSISHGRPGMRRTRPAQRGILDEQPCGRCQPIRSDKTGRLANENRPAMARTVGARYRGAWATRWIHEPSRGNDHRSMRELRTPQSRTQRRQRRAALRSVPSTAALDR
jgi:MFS family permease